MKEVLNPFAGQLQLINSSTGGGGSYTLPTASTTVLGGVKVDGTTVTIASGVISATGGGGGALPVQDFKTHQVDATNLYSGIAGKGTATSATSWSLIKKVYTNPTRDGMAIYTATDSWDNHLTASYTLSNTYSF